MFNAAVFSEDGGRQLSEIMRKWYEMRGEELRFDPGDIDNQFVNHGLPQPCLRVLEAAQLRGGRTFIIIV